MKNIITGYVTSLVGLVIMLIAICDFFGFVHIPAPEGISEYTQVCTAFIVGLVLLLLPASFIEDTLKKIISKKTSD